MFVLIQTKLTAAHAVTAIQTLVASAATYGNVSAGVTGRCSLCMLLAAAFTASIPPRFFMCRAVVVAVAGVLAALLRQSLLLHLNSGLRSPMVGCLHPTFVAEFCTSGVSST